MVMGRMPHSTLSQESAPFQTKAQPRYVEWRTQAIAVWYGLVDFLVYVWSSDEDGEAALHRIGFEPNRIMVTLIDDLYLYATIKQWFHAKTDVVVDDLRAVFYTAITDASPSVRTNPLLWWMALLVHANVVKQYPRLPIQAGKVVDTLDFADKLEALDHYARALLFDTTFYRWMNSSRNAYGEGGSHEKEIALWTMGTDIKWVDEDQEAAPNDGRKDPDLTTAAWQAWHGKLREVVETWLTANTAGPMHEILALRACTVPRPRSSQPPADDHNPRYRIEYTTVHNWRDSPHQIAHDSLQGTHITVYDDLAAANRAVRNIAMGALRQPLDAGVHEFRETKALFDRGNGQTPAYTIVNGREFSVVHLQSETFDVKGMKRLRLLFCDEYDDTVKVVAWVKTVGGGEE
ncbi:hypothetical protein LTR37_016121 [Vermiconidia calcicola]|uniref:Uncharacterized protein n=1 Tax=Vermiconidia calcicola TaxID=1690605 RepID=A0ACC3MNQ5_9PEZI|nr:hypothetical protein LTR37_016121 [Vermiconidia calcicola]